MADVIFEDAPEAGAEAEAQVVVVGAGAAGLTAALSARQAGAQVLLLERDARPSGLTAMSQGAVCAAGSRVQREAGIEDSPERLIEDVRAKTGGTADPVMTRLIAEASGPVMDWLTDEVGLPYRVNPEWAGVFGHSVNRLHSLPSQTGAEMSARLLEACEAAGVRLACGAHVARLHAAPEGRIGAATVRRPDGREERIACSALVAATCGFGANREMVREHIPDFGRSPVYRHHGHEGNDGAGIRWGLALGAAAGSMDGFQGYGALAHPEAVLLNYNVFMDGGVQVNVRGARFCDELADISGQGQRVLAQPEGIAWALFDAAREARAKDLAEYRDLLALGAVKAADDVAAAAERIGCEASALAETLAAVEAAARGEAADPFGRDFRGAAPLAPPYRLVRITGALFHTQGGLQLDAEGRVARADGGVLPNFFAAGGTARGMSGSGSSGYLPAAGLASAVTLGRIAGRMAAAV